MPTNITDAQNRVRNFYKSDALAQTNQIRYDCYYHAWHKKHKKLFSQGLKLGTKNTGTFFYILYCSLISQWKNWVKK